MKLWILCGASCCVRLPRMQRKLTVRTDVHSEEPKLYDHYVSFKHMQERLAGRSLEEQAKLQPQIQRAQQKACAATSQRTIRSESQERSTAVREETNSSCFRWNSSNGARQVDRGLDTRYLSCSSHYNATEKRCNIRSQ